MHLPLNEPVLLLLPSNETGLEHNYVTRVVVETKGRTCNASTLISFYLAQDEISRLIPKVITAHLHEPLPSSSILFQGDAYTLLAEVGTWEFGQKLELKWGDRDVISCAERWMFQFKKSPTKPSSNSLLRVIKV